MQIVWDHHEDELCEIFAAGFQSIPEPPESGLEYEGDDVTPF